MKRKFFVLRVVMIAAALLTACATNQGSVLFFIIVPSIDTAVCEAKTHFLGEEGDALPALIKRITIS